MLGDVRYTLETERGNLLYIRSRGVRHGTPEILERLVRGETVDAAEYTLRTAVKIETGADGLDWLNNEVLVSVGGRLPGGPVAEFSVDI